MRLLLVLGLMSVSAYAVDIGPVMGAYIPVQEPEDPWRTSFLIGVRALFPAGPVSIEAELDISPLQIDPDSSRGYDYSIVPITAGVRAPFWVMYGSGGFSIYHLEAKKDIGDMQAVWEGTFPGAYFSLGKEVQLSGVKLDFCSKFDIIDFDGVWIGITGGVLF